MLKIFFKIFADIITSLIIQNEAFTKLKSKLLKFTV